MPARKKLIGFRDVVIVCAPMKTRLVLLLLCRLWTVHIWAAPVPLLDEKSLAGWEGETNSVWRIRDGVIVGGSLNGNPRNEFLATQKRYTNFHLRLEYKLVGTDKGAICPFRHVRHRARRGLVRLRQGQGEGRV